jgi:hypothetical protein
MKTHVRFEMPFDARGALQFFSDYAEIERVFNCEYSCGDGRFLSDIDMYHLDFDKYDGELDPSLVRINGLVYKEYTLSFTFDEDHRTSVGDEISSVKITHKKLA